MSKQKHKQQIVESQAKAQERRDAEEKLHNDDVERIQRTNDQLKVSLEPSCGSQEVDIYVYMRRKSNNNTGKSN